jgi:hypothetical protein
MPPHPARAEVRFIATHARRVGNDATVPPLRYYVLATYGSRTVELFKVEQRTNDVVVVPSLANRTVGTTSIHLTHHLPRLGQATRIVHVSDSKGTDERIPLPPEAPYVLIGRLILDLSGLDWSDAKEFSKIAFAEKYVHDISQHGAYVEARFYMGEPTVLLRALDALVRSGELGIVIPKPGGFGTPPGGQEIHSARLVFDDEAEVTVACLLLSCHPPEIDASSDKPWTGEQLQWVAYGSEGKSNVA